MKIIGDIPYDDNLIESERNGVAPIDFNSDAPSIKEISKIASWISQN